jgi:hypothetical protein
MLDINYIQNTALVMATAWNAPLNIEIHDTTQATGTTYLPANIKANAHTASMNQGREIRNLGLNVVAIATSGIRGWDRSAFNTAPNLWDHSVSGIIIGLASKSTTTWFLAGANAAFFYLCYFETVNSY